MKPLAVFNRLFVVAAFSWTLYCSVVFPLTQRANWLTSLDHDRTSLEEICHKDALYGTIPDLNYCLKVAQDNWEYGYHSYTVSSLYAAYWPFILAAIVGVPLIVYGTVRGLAVIAFWVWHGSVVHQRRSTDR